MVGGIFLWIMLAVVVGVAANTRGRSGLGWFLLSLLISPLIAGLLVLASPRVRQEDETAFKPQGVLKGFPYRVGAGGGVEAMLQGGLVRFANMDQFRAAAEGRDVVPLAPGASTTYRGYTYFGRPDEAELKLTYGGTKHFATEEEARAHVDLILD